MGPFISFAEFIALDLPGLAGGALKYAFLDLPFRLLDLARTLISLTFGWLGLAIAVSAMTFLIQTGNPIAFGAVSVAKYVAGTTAQAVPVAAYRSYVVGKDCLSDAAQGVMNAGASEGRCAGSVIRNATIDPQVGTKAIGGLIDAASVADGGTMKRLMADPRPANVLDAVRRGPGSR